jgi:hypothetical protein
MGPISVHIRGSVEEQNSVHQLFRMNHFFDGLFAVESSEPEVAPALTHLRMEEVLVNGSEFRFKRLAQILENFIVSSHARILASGVSPFNSGSVPGHPTHVMAQKKLRFRLAVVSVWNHSVMYAESLTSELV